MIDKEIEERLRRAHQLYQAKDYNDAARELIAILNNHPDHFRALYAFSLVTRAAENFGVSLLAARRCYELQPQHAHVVNSLGMSFADVGDEESATSLYLRAFEMEPHAITAQNLGNLYANRGAAQKALEWFERARALSEEEHITASIAKNEAHALLMLRQWREGWEKYNRGIGGSRHRPDKLYGAAELWDGGPIAGGPLVLYGEQGIGDEIMLGSCIPDAAKAAGCKVIIDVQARLKGLFARSFPDAEVYGTRTTDSPYWMTRDDKPTHRSAFSRLSGMFRNDDAAFPGTPFLIADPLRRSMYRTLLDGINRVHPRRPKVGLAWTGGMINTGRDRRSLDMERLSPLLAAFPRVDWISLQYMDAPEAESHGIHHFPFATQSKDYDDTAALVAELDAVVTVQTAVVHLSGALGKACHVLVSNRPVWRYGSDGEDMLWYKSVKLHRQTQDGDWNPAIEQVVTALKARFATGGY